MYKLFKMFTSKAKQVARDKEKAAGGGLTGGVVKKDKDSTTQKQEYAPLKLTTQIQDNIKLFKVI